MQKKRLQGNSYGQNRLQNQLIFRVYFKCPSISISWLWYGIDSSEQNSPELIIIEFRRTI